MFTDDNIKETSKKSELYGRRENRNLDYLL